MYSAITSSVTFPLVGRSGDPYQRIFARAAMASGLHQAGRNFESHAKFREAEALQARRHPKYPLLSSVRGFLYCDLLLASAEWTAWTAFAPASRQDLNATIQSCRAVSDRAARALEIGAQNHWLLDIALDHLTLGRAALYVSILEPRNSNLTTATTHITAAVDGLRRAGTLDELPRGLLTRAWLFFVKGVGTGPDSAQTDLDEAWEIAERGPMPLFFVDIHLYRARLFAKTSPYPWESPQADLAAARGLIEKHGYARRIPELEAAEKAMEVGA